MMVEARLSSPSKNETLSSHALVFGLEDVSSVFDRLTYISTGPTCQELQPESLDAILKHQ